MRDSTSPPPPSAVMPVGIPLNKDIGQLVTGMGFELGDWDVYRREMAEIESAGKYGDPGGANKHYDGRYQLGRKAKKGAAAQLGETAPAHYPADRLAYRNNPEMQERYFAAFTKANHNYLMKKNPEYAEASPRRKLQILGYAHNQGMGGADTWLTEGKVGADAWGTKGTKYSEAIAAAFDKEETARPDGQRVFGGSMGSLPPPIADERKDLINVKLTSEDVRELYSSYNENNRNNWEENEELSELELERELAKTLVNELKGQGAFLEYPMDYKGLREGTSALSQELGWEKGLTDLQIIEAFAVNPDGEQINLDPSATLGVAEAAAGSVGFMAGMWKGAAGANALVSGVPPVTPWTAALRVLAPVVGGVAGGLAGQWGGDTLTRAVAGAAPLVLPGERSQNFRIAKAVTANTPFILAPFNIGANLGARVVVKNLAESASKTRSLAAVAGVERVLAGIGTRARASPVATAVGETTAAGAGGALGVYGHDATDSALGTIGGEVLGGLTGSAVQSFSQTLGETAPRAAREAWTKARDIVPERFGGFSPGQKQAASQEKARVLIREAVRTAGEDPKEILRNLGDFPSLLGPDGVPLEISPVIESASQSLVALQRAVAPTPVDKNLMRDVGKSVQREIQELTNEGSAESLSEVAQIMDNLEKLRLEANLATSVTKTQNAVKKVYPRPSSSLDEVEPPLNAQSNAVDLEAAKALLETVDISYKGARSAESLAHKDVPHTVTSEFFINDMGLKTRTPTFLTEWEKFEKEFAENPSLWNSLMKVDGLSTLQKAVKEAREQLGLPLEGPVDASPLLPEEVALQGALEKLVLTGNQSKTRQLVVDLREKEVLPAMIARTLRDEANSVMKAAANRGTGEAEAAKDLAGAYNAQADLVLAQQAQHYQMENAKYMGRVAGESGTAPLGGGLSANSIQKNRGFALSVARASDVPDQAHRIAATMAEAMRTDLNSFPRGVSEPLDRANRISKALNDVYTRAIGGALLFDKHNNGKRVWTPDSVSRDLLSGDAAFGRAQELDAMAQFSITQSLTNLLEITNAGENVKPIADKLLKSFQSVKAASAIETYPTIKMTEMREWLGENRALIDEIPGLFARIQEAMNSAVTIRGASETLLRKARSETLALDGTVNPEALRAFRDKDTNKRLLAMFPDLEADLKDVESARIAMEKAVLENPRKLEEARELAGLQELLPDKNQSPVTALSWYFVPQEANPFFRLNKITKMIDAAKDKGFTVEAKGSPNKGETWTADDLRKGLTKAIYGSILDESAEAGVFDPAKAYGKLFGKRGKAQNVSLAEWMKEKELISVEQLDNTEKLLAQLTQIQEFSAIADRKGGKLESLIDLSDISEPTKGLAAVIGSGAGAKVADAVGMRSSLVLQGRLTGGAVRAAQQILTKQPSSNTLEAIGAVLADKDLLAATLKMGDSLEENSSIFQEWVGTLVNNWVLAPVRRTAVSALQDGKPFDADERGEPAPPLQAPAQQAPAPAPQVPAQQVPAQQAPAQQVPAQQAPAPVAPAPAPVAQAGSVDRDRFAALFPEERELMGLGRAIEAEA